MFLFSALDDSAMERIIYHMLEKTCEIDAMSYRYEAIINLLKSLREEGDFELIDRVEAIIKRYINEKMSIRNNVILSEIFSNNAKRIRKYDIDNLYAM